jgi:hypothetical protein
MTSSTQNPSSGTPAHQSAQANAIATSPPSKRDLKSWWKGFKLPSKHHEPNGTNHSCRGIPCPSTIPNLPSRTWGRGPRVRAHVYPHLPTLAIMCLFLHAARACPSMQPCRTAEANLELGSRALCRTGCAVLLVRPGIPAWHGMAGRPRAAS